MLIRDEASREGIFQKWSVGDIARVEALNLKDGNNHLPKTKQYADTPTWIFYERLTHILEGDLDFDFQDFGIDDLKIIDWLEIKIVIQKMKGEEPEEYDPNISPNDVVNMANLKYVRNFLIDNFEQDFGLREIG